MTTLSDVQIIALAPGPRPLALTGVDFSGVYLAQTGLRGANVTDADFYNARLRNATMPAGKRHK